MSFTVSMPGVGPLATDGDDVAISTKEVAKDLVRDVAQPHLVVGLFNLQRFPGSATNVD